MKYVGVVFILAGMIFLGYGMHVHSSECKKAGGRMAQHEGCVYSDNTSQDTLNFWIDRWTK